MILPSTMMIMGGMCSHGYRKRGVGGLFCCIYAGAWTGYALSVDDLGPEEDGR